MTSIAPIKTTHSIAAKAHALLQRLRTNTVDYPLGYLATLDGARGFMTLGVMLAHTRAALFEGAMVYMDVFFTMSGYLITSILIKDYQRRGKISLRKFYFRRILRLYPALIAMVTSLVILSWFFSPEFQDRLTEAAAALFYLMDYWITMFPGVKYTGHTWSLAVEEQFYLIWPLLFILLLRIFGLSVRTAKIIFVMAALFWLWRIYAASHGTSYEDLYPRFDFRADALLVGCGLSVLLSKIDLSSYPRFWRFCSLSLGPLAVGMIVVGLTMNHRMMWYYYVSPLFGAIPSAISVIGLLHPDRTFMHRLYEHPVPVFCGRICYGLYVWHVPIFVWISSWPTKLYIILFLVGWPLTFVVATLSYYLIERPAMRIRPAI